MEGEREGEGEKTQRTTRAHIKHMVECARVLQGELASHVGPHRTYATFRMLLAKASLDHSSNGSDPREGESLVLWIVVGRKSEQGFEGSVQTRQPGDF